MAEAKKQEKKPSNGALGFDPKYVHFLENVYERWVENVFKLSGEISQFAQNCIHRDVAAWAQIAACRDPKELIECERAIATDAMNSFAEDVIRISQLIVTLAGVSYDPANGEGSAGRNPPPTS